MDIQKLGSSLLARAAAMTPRARAIAATGAAIALIGTTATVRLASDSDESAESKRNDPSALAVPVEVVGADIVDGEQPGMSWPGEVISAGDAQIQPPREGTLVEWKVGIGQAVQRGQTLGRLLAPGSSPENAATLAEADLALAEARAELEAQLAFTDARKRQLADVRASLGQGAAGSDLGFRIEAVRDFSAQAVRAIYLHVTNKEGEDPIRVYRENPGGFSVPYRTGAGKTSETAKKDFSRDIVALMRGIVRNENVADAAKQFLRSADALVASSADLDGVEEVPGVRDPMGELTETVAEQREQLFEKIAELNEVRLESSITGAEVGELLLEVDKELSLARSKLQAAQAAYNSINDAVGRDINIVAPQSGVVSALVTQPGEFVGLDTTVASVNAGADKTIRFRIPGNITPPKAGETLSAVRPGFAKDVKAVKVSGVGEALDRNGSRLADATFVDPVDWPVHASVRVTAGGDSSAAPPLVSLTAIWFDDQGKSNVWVVGDDDRIQPQPVKTGRSLGDKIELIEGPPPGTRIVSVAGPALRSGMKLPKATAAPDKTDAEPAGDGHDHEH